MSELKVKQLVEKAIVGITVSNRPKMRYHIKLFPYVEVSGERVHLEVLQSELLKFSVGSTLRPKFLRIQGIENCSIMTRFLDKNKYQWWFECMELFVDKQHLSRKGIKTILNKRPFVKNQGLRVKDQEIIHALMSA